MGEYEYGLLGSKHRQRLGRLFQKLESESVVLYADRQTVVAYAQIRYELSHGGTPIPENDIWIAAITRQYELPLVSNDSHFDNVRGLQRLHW